MSLNDRQRYILSSRTLGENIPVSISTALAVESLLGQNPEAPDPDSKWEQIDILYVNTRTLVRNLLGSIATESKKTDISVELVLEYVYQEMITIQSAIEEASYGDVKVAYYSPTYAEIYSTSNYRHGTVREYNTPLQTYQALREKHVQLNISKYIADGDVTLTHIDVNTVLPRVPSRAALLTHYCVDLMSRYSFKTLHLLESHTGAFKGPQDWYTKLTGYKDRPPMPFDKATLQVFGDSATFRSSKIKLRRTFIDMAIQHKWTPMSTQDLVIHSAKMLNDPFFMTYVLELYK